MCLKIQKWFDSHFTTKYINRNSYSITLPFISNNKDYVKIIFHVFKCLVVLGKKKMVQMKTILSHVKVNKESKKINLQLILRLLPNIKKIK